jgi:hypothetical protein
LIWPAGEYFAILVLALIVELVVSQALIISLAALFFAGYCAVDAAGMAARVRGFSREE